MKKIMVIIFLMFFIVGCHRNNKHEEELQLNYEFASELKIVLESKEDLLDNNNYGLIYKFNPTIEDLKSFNLDSDFLFDVKLEKRENEKFLYVLDDAKLTVFDYVVPLLIKGYSISDNNQVTYSEALNINLYKLANEFETSYANKIKSEVRSSIIYTRNITSEELIDEENEGFKVNVDFSNYEDFDKFGLIYKEAFTYNYKDELYFNSLNITHYIKESLNNNILMFNVKNIEEDDYFKDYEYRVFIFDEENNKIILSRFSKSFSIYGLALKGKGRFSNKVINSVISKYKIITEFEVDTDKNKDYEFYQVSKGIEGKLETDFNDITLVLTTKKGYKFSPDLTKEDIIIRVIRDNNIVKDFELYLYSNLIIIVYDDHGWGPPM